MSMFTAVIVAPSTAARDFAIPMDVLDPDRVGAAPAPERT
jgi:hypothetical protein